MATKRKRLTNINYETVNKQLEAKRQEEEQKKLIEQQYQSELASQNKRSKLDRVFDVLNTGGYAVNGFVQEGLQGAWEGAKAGLDGFVPGTKEYGKEYNFKDSLDSLSDGKWSGWNKDTNTAGKAIDALKQGEVGKFGVAFLKGATEFAGEVLTDPTTYLGGAGIVKSVTKGSGKRVGGEVVEKITTQAIKEAGQKAGVELTEKQILKYANKANKMVGATGTAGDVTFAGKTLTGSGDALRKLGDKTIAPIYNSATDAIRKSGILTPLDTSQSLKKALDTGKLDEFVATLGAKDSLIKNKISRTRYVGNTLESARSMFRGDAKTKKGQRQIMDIIEDPESYAVIKSYDEVGDFGQKVIKDYIEVAQGKSYDEMTDKTAKKVWDKVLSSEKPFEAMQTNNPFEQYVIKKMIDPDGQYKTYQEAYNNFLVNQNVQIKAIPIIQEPIKKVEDVVARTSRALTDLDIETGVFVNTSNVEKYQKLLKNNASMAKVVSMNDKRKAQWLNAVLFDGKPIIQVEGIKKADGRLNGILEAIKQGADESTIMQKLEGMIGKIDEDTFPIEAIFHGADNLDVIEKEVAQFANKPFIDIALDAEQLRIFNETGKLPGYSDIQKEYLARSGKQVRIYDKETRELIFDNLDGTFKKRLSPHAESLRTAKQAKLSAIQDIAEGKATKTSDFIDAIHQEKRAIIDNHANQLYEMMDDELKMMAQSDTIRKNFLATMGDSTDEAVELLRQYDRLKDGIVDDVALYNDIMKLDAKLPPAYQVKDTYVQTRITPTGEIFEVTFNPYTRETTEQVVERTILQELGEVPEATMSELDHFINFQHTDELLTQSIRDFLKSSGQNVEDNLVVKQGKLYAEKIEYRIKENDITMSKDIKRAVDFMVEEFKRIGMMERQSQDLRTMLNNYVPHVLNPEILKNPQMLEKLKKQDPELYRTIFASSGDKYNRFGTQRSKILEEKVRSILAKQAKDTGTEYNGMGRTVAEVNKALAPLLKEYGFDGDFFIHEIFDAYSQRLVTHGELIYADKTIDDILRNFGVPVTMNQANPKKTYYLNQRNMKDIFSGLDETQQYMLLQEMGVDFDRVLNKMMIEIPGDKADKLYKAVEKYGNATLELYELPKSLAEFAQQKGYTQQLHDTNGFLKVYDKFTNIWKQSATVINPGFHIRNGFSNVFQNYLAVGAEVFNPSTRNTVKRILRGEDGTFMTKGDTPISFQMVRDWIVGYDITSMQNFDMANQSLKSKTLFGEELKGGGGILEAIGRKVGLNDPKAFNRIDPTDTSNFFAYSLGRQFGGDIEDFDRALNFIANLKNGLDVEDAAEMVDKFLFDYSDLTAFESNVMKRIIPFYTWLRKNAPLQMEMLLEKPGLYAGIGDVHRLANGDDDNQFVSGYMDDWIKLPVQFHNKDMYLNPNMPYQNVTDMMMSPSDAIGMLNPAIKTILEVGTNHNNFFDSQIYNDDDTISEAMSKVGKYTTNSLAGAWQTWVKGIGAVASGDTEKMLSSTGSLATGVKIGLHDEQKSKEDAIYRAIRTIEEQVANNKSNQKFNNTFEEYKQTKLEKYGYK